MEGFIASTAEFGQYSPPAALGWLACGVVTRTFLQFLFRAVEDQKGIPTQAHRVLGLAGTQSIRPRIAGGEFLIKPCACHRRLLAPMPSRVLTCRVLDAAFLNRTAIRRTEEACVLGLRLCHHAGCFRPLPWRPQR